MRKNELHSRYYTITIATIAKVSPVMIIAVAAAFYFLEFRFLIAVALAAAVHELGHIMALRLHGFVIGRVSIGAQGLCIDYSGTGSTCAHAVVAAAGPMAGFLLARVASNAANLTGLAWLEILSGVSLTLTVFNILPLLPLDGGRIALAMLSALVGDARAERVIAAVSYGAAVIILVIGTVHFTRGGGVRLLAMGLWLAGCIFT